MSVVTLRPPLNRRNDRSRTAGDVFADLRLPDAEERLLKAQLAAEIARIIAGRKLTQRAAAELL